MKQEIEQLTPMQRKRLLERAKSIKLSRQAGPLPPLDMAAPGERSALSFAQRRLWMLAQLDGASAAYHIPMVWRLQGRLDVDALRNALDRLVARHEVLRTHFALTEGEPQQVIVPEGKARCAYQVIDLRGTPDPHTALTESMAAAVVAQFDLENGPLLRAVLYCLAEQEHVLLLNMHHIVSDAWSLGILQRELSTLYAAFAGGADDPLPPVALQYADYAAWQRVVLASGAIAQQATYWKESLAGAPMLLEVPRDYARPARQDYAGAYAPLTLAPALVAGLQALCARHGTTMFMTLLAAWAALLARLSGQQDLVIGIPSANRGRAELDDMLGFFVNTLPLRLQLGGTLTVAQLLAHVKEQMLAAQSSQDIPFEQIVELVQPARNSAYAPVFQVMFSWANAPGAELELPGVVLGTPPPLPYRPAKVDLTLALAESANSICGGIEYAASLFAPATVERYIAYLQVMLGAMIADPGAPVAQLPYLPAPERQVLLADWNATDVDHGHDKCIHVLFEEQAQRTPQAIALIEGNATMQYDALNARANRLAHQLHSLGARRGTRIALCAEPGIAMVAGLLAVLKTGAAYVPLNPAYPDERLGAMLADCGAIAVLTHTPLRSRCGALAGPLALIDLDAAAADGWDWPQDNPAQSEVQADDLAYVIYTSGSTGQPKGVMNHHRGVVNLLLSIGAHIGFGAADCLLSVTNPGFDIAALELYLPLISGARLVLASPQQRADPGLLGAALAAAQASVMQATPATWRMLLEHGWRGAPGLRALCGGEALPVPLAERLRERVAMLWNVYGPTETTIWSTLAPVEQSVQARGAAWPIGRPLANTQVYVLDELGQPVAAGVTGEVYIGGVGVAHGYLGQPDLTAERFVPDPFRTAPHARLYRTGDLGRWLPDGQLEYQGRNDFQVKVRGHRIELGEVERCLCTHTGVAEAVVVAREVQPGDTGLVAYVVPQTAAAGSSPAADQPSFSLFYFGADAEQAADKYQFYLAAARFADQHGFEAVWTPERHFHEIGSLYPNPALLNAALATITDHVKLRSGSVVLPLHHPIRVAEEWAVVDNLSHGRAGLAITNGWHPRDFALAPECYAGRNTLVRESISTLKALWAGRALGVVDGNGQPAQVRTYPRPVQAELPLWITAAGNPETFAYAGQIGANVLTHLLGQNLDQLEQNIQLYRNSLAEYGHDPQRGRVTVMVHTYVGDDEDAVRAAARDPFKRYMRSHLGLLRPLIEGEGMAVDLQSEDDLDKITEFAFERYARSAALIGTPQSCRALAVRLHHIGTDEIACLIDWMDAPAALAGLAALERLRQLAQSTSLDRQALMRHCQRSLPDFMVPGAIVLMDRLPLTPNGKLDRKALPVPAAPAAPSYAAPQGTVETALAGIWAELLNLERVGRYDNFFDLGGHSLLVVQLGARLNVELGVEMRLGDLFAHPVLAELAMLLVAAEPARLGAITRASDEERRQLSFAQLRLWLQAQMDGLSQAYHDAIVLRYRGQLDCAAMACALDRIIARHEILRTTYVLEGAQPQARIGTVESSKVLLQEHDLRGHADPEEQAAHLLELQARTVFDLGRGPLVRASLLALPRDEHVLAITLHHMVSDGWSRAVFFDELHALYTAFQHGQADPLPALAIQYADYAAWQRRWIAGEVLHQQAQFWKDALAGAPPLLALPTDRPRPAQQGYTGASVPFVIEAALATQLRALSKRHGTSLYMTVLAAWSALLARLSGQDDLVIGTPVGNRTRIETESLIGCFINTLPIRIDLSGALTVQALLAQTKRQVLDAQHHQDIPFEQVVEAVQPVRSTSHTPIFQVMFSWHNNPGGQLALPGVDLVQVSGGDTFSAKFDLMLSLHDGQASIVGGITYASELFEASTIERWAGHLTRLLGEMVRDDQQAVTELSLLSLAERRQLVTQFNATPAADPCDALVHQLFEAQVAAQPDAVALCYEAQQLSYGELNRRANQVAHYLLGLGVGTGDRVAICVERSLEMVVGILGILKAGCAYVPLDPTYPADRLAHMLADSAPSALLTQAHVQAGLPATPVPVLQIDTLSAPLAQQPASNPDPASLGLTGRHVAYVIYTSGSTGQSKGVMVEHRSAVNFWSVLASTTHRSCPQNAAIALNASYTFDMSLKGLLQLLSGHCVFIIAQQVRTDPAAMCAFLERYAIDAFDCTPSQLEMLLAAGMLDNPRYQPKRVLIGGEAISGATWERLKRSPRTCFFNMYGPTEATVDATIGLIGEADRAPHIGTPIANVQVHILDTRLKPVPIGVAGEIHIGGIGVARGYLNRASLTAERFIDDPFSAEDGARLYKTGDLGRWLPDGKIEYIGRNDFQVKIRGFRIELGEIEAQLQACDGVREAVVLAREDAPGEKRLVAYLLAQTGRPLAPGALRAQLRKVLAEHMVPSAFVTLDAFPLTPNGKLDRSALPAPDLDAYAASDYAPPVGAVEQALAAIWCELLMLERVGRHDNFFELGGNSLLMVALVERMRRSGLQVDLRALFATPTLAELAAVAGSDTAPAAVPPNRIAPDCRVIRPDMLTLVKMDEAEIACVTDAVPGGAANVQDIYPLAPLQEGIFFHYQLGGAGDAYLLASIYGFDSRERLDCFLDAMQGVIDRHDILRTCVLWEGLADPVQVVLRRVQMAAREHILDPAAGDVCEQLRTRFDPLRCRIDIRQAPMMQAHYAYDPAGGRWLLLLLQHHLAGDHTTMDVMRQEIVAHMKGQAGQLEPPIAFRNFVARARQAAQAAENESFFRALLGDVTQPTAPFGLLDVQGDGSGLAKARIVLAPGLAHRLRAQARTLGVANASLFHVAWAMVLARLTGRSDMVFGTVLFGRMLAGEGADRVMGLFMNTLPVRVRLDVDRAAAAVKGMHALLADLLRHEHASLALAQRCSGVAAPTPLFSSLLNYRYSADGAASGDWEGIEALHGGDRTNYPVVMAIDDLGAGFALSAQVLAVVDPERVCRYMETALERLTEALDLRHASALAELDVLPAAERHLVLEQWNGTATAIGPGPLPCVHEMFAAQVRLRPQAPAVIYGGTELSYLALDARADALAARLDALGARPGVRVAVCLERSADMLAALLAVAKTGAAYVPIDPAYPPQRIAYVLDDAQAQLCVSARALRTALPPAGPALVYVEDIDAQGTLARYHCNHPAGADDTAYLMYTSGSTGAPKGVMVSHAALSNFLESMRVAPGMGAGDKLLAISSVGFDISGLELYLPLIAGGQVEIASREQARDPAWLAAAIADGVTVMQATPATWRMLVDHGWGEARGLRALSGGDVLTPDLARALLERVGQLWNLYGPTETTIWSALARIEQVGNSVPLGRPVANTRLYILDAKGAPVALGMVGELHIGGAGVAQGYWRRPELTAERFLADPFAPPHGGAARMYRTGDLARWRADGGIDFLGRSDLQVKVRGFRIELGEIETTLATHAMVRQAAVMAYPDAMGEQRLVAFYTAAEACTDAKQEGALLRAYLAGRLPEHMVPAQLVRLATLPLTTNGKLDRSALALPASVPCGDGGAPASGALETALAVLWCELLGLEQVGRHDNFFALGGHSLLAVRLIERARRRGLAIEIRTLFANPVLADLAAALGAAPAGMADSAAIDAWEISI